MRRHLALAAVMLGLVLSGCSGDDEDTPTTRVPSGGAEAPGEGATPPSDAGALPPEFLRCMAEQGFEVKSSADIHSAPQQALQACFGSIH